MKCQVCEKKMEKEYGYAELTSRKGGYYWEFLCKECWGKLEEAFKLLHEIGMEKWDKEKKPKKK